jgi:16S rRNA (uracil1498-N3)-methyltransferase
MHTFYCPEIHKDNAVLNAEESGHCIRVLRLGKGEQVVLIDGIGGMFNAEIVEANPKKCLLHITDSIQVSPTRKFRLHIAIAPTKSMDRFEWFVEKAVEIGVDSITPLLCQRSERKVINNERLLKLVISTMKQAMVPSKPVINEIIPFDRLIKGYEGPHANRFIAHCERTLRKPLVSSLIQETDTIILIGPEGDFTPDEIKTATEKAGIVACCLINA